jgi:hypothetical protein
MLPTDKKLTGSTDVIRPCHESMKDQIRVLASNSYIGSHVAVTRSPSESRVSGDYPPRHDSSASIILETVSDACLTESFTTGLTEHWY